MDPILPTIPTGLSDAQMWAVIVGVVVPFALSFIMKATWSASTKALITFGVSAVVGTVTALLSGAFNGLSILGTVFTVFLTSVIVYQHFISKVLPNLQRGSEEKAAIEQAVEAAKIEAIAAPIAAEVAVEKVEEKIDVLPVGSADAADAEPDAVEDESGPGAHELEGDEPSEEVWLRGGQ